MGTELKMTAFAPASSGGGVKPGGRAMPPPLEPRIPVLLTRCQCTRSGLRSSETMSSDSEREARRSEKPPLT